MSATQAWHEFLREHATPPWQKTPAHLHLLPTINKAQLTPTPLPEDQGDPLLSAHTGCGRASQGLQQSRRGASIRGGASRDNAPAGPPLTPPPFIASRLPFPSALLPLYPEAFKAASMADVDMTDFGAAQRLLEATKIVDVCKK